ncbi:MAG: Flp family type IVb pilin [bacterium]|jgi:pilus assembly protein Flp/PilA
MLSLAKRLWQEETGQGMVEYGLIIALVAVALIVALTSLKDGLAGIFGKVEEELDGATTS